MATLFYIQALGYWKQLQEEQCNFYFQDDQRGYFCDDNSSFGEAEAKVFCRMLGWPTGKTLASKTPIESRRLAANRVISSVACNGDELHISDCDNTVISKVILPLSRCITLSWVCIRLSLCILYCYVDMPQWLMLPLCCSK